MRQNTNNLHAVLTYFPCLLESRDQRKKKRAGIPHGSQGRKGRKRANSMPAIGEPGKWTHADKPQSHSTKIIVHMLCPVKDRALTASFYCYFLLPTDIPFFGIDSLPEKHRDTVAKKDAVAVEKMPKRTARPNVMSDTEMEVIITLSSH